MIKYGTGKAAVPTREQPIYSKVLQDDSSATKMYMIICNEGWRSLIVCADMYGWAADWLLRVLERRPYNDGNAP